MKIYIETLGCPKNEADSQLLKSLLPSGSHIVSTPSEAECVVVNTCAFIQDAQKESIETLLEYVLQWKQEQPDKRRVYAWGCLVQRFLKALQKEIPELDGFIGVLPVDRISEGLFSHCLGERSKPLVLYSEDPDTTCALSSQFFESPPYYAYVKIGDGCDRNCGFCTIPSFKGPHRSRPMTHICREVEELVRKGKKELILVDQDTTQYRDGEYSLADLLRSLDAIEGDFWIRVLYTHPDHFDPPLLESFAACDKVLPYFDIPIQHAADSVLRAMNRIKGREDLGAIFRLIRERIPDAVLRSTVMVGYPGETEEDFEKLVAFLKEAQFDRLGVFRFSPEKGAPVNKKRLDKVGAKVSERRLDEIMTLQQEISYEKNQRFLGKTFRVLVEAEESHYVGRTMRDAPDVDGLFDIYTDKQLTLGEFYTCRVTEADAYDLGGTPE